MGWWQLPVLQQLERRLGDLRTLVTMPRTLDERIVIVHVDEPDLAEFGQWPWPRQLIARLLDELLNRQEAAAVGLDIVFAEPERHLGALQSEDAGPSPGDRALADALADQPAVLAYYFTSDHLGHRSGRLPGPLAWQTPWTKLVYWDGYSAPVATLTQAASASGFINALTDADGRLRTVPLLAGFGGGIYESFDLALLRQGFGDHSVGLSPGSSAPGAPRAVSLIGKSGTLELPMAADGTVLVPYRGAGGPNGGSFPYISAIDVLNQHLAAGSLAGRYVLLGFTAPGLYDMHSTPVSTHFPGVEIHANVLSAALDGRLPYRPAWAGRYELGVLLLLGLIFTLLTGRWQPAAQLILGATTLIAVVLVNLAFYLRWHLVLPLSSILAFAALVFLGDMLLSYLVEGRAMRALARQFSSYVPPEIVRQMMKNPAHYDMQARTEELSVMFCDLQDFTTLAETMQPADVQVLLGDVLGLMTREVRRRGGTVDKYMGDCLMAFWGAPVANPEHAADAVETGFSILSCLAEYNLQRAQQGLAEVEATIGIHTGKMRVGDMGTSYRRAYTVIGDAVNLASRLENLAEDYGVGLVVSEATMQAAGHESFIWQELDCVRVRGRDAAERVYTLRGRTPAPAVLLSELLLWQRALDAWREGELDACTRQIEALREMAPERSLYALYAARLRHWKAHPLPRGAPWDPVAVSTHH